MDYQNILIAIPKSERAHDIFKEGIKLAKIANAKVTLCHINENKYIFSGYPSAGIFFPHTFVEIEDPNDIEEVLNKYKEEAIKLGVKDVEIVITSSSTPALSITEVVATNYKCNLIVCGCSEKKGIFKFLGSTAIDITKNAHCDVWVIKNKA